MVTITVAKKSLVFQEPPHKGYVMVKGKQFEVKAVVTQLCINSNVYHRKKEKWQLQKVSLDLIEEQQPKSLQTCKIGYHLALSQESEGREKHKRALSEVDETGLKEEQDERLANEIHIRQDSREEFFSQPIYKKFKGDRLVSMIQAESVVSQNSNIEQVMSSADIVNNSQTIRFNPNYLSQPLNKPTIKGKRKPANGKLFPVRI